MAFQKDELLYSKVAGLREIDNQLTLFGMQSMRSNIEGVQTLFYSEVNANNVVDHMTSDVARQYINRLEGSVMTSNIQFTDTYANLQFKKICLLEDACGLSNISQQNDIKDMLNII